MMSHSRNRRPEHLLKMLPVSAFIDRRRQAFRCSEDYQEVDDGGLHETDDRFIIQYDLERLRLFCETKEFELAQTWVQKIIERGKELRDPIAIAETLRISSEIASKRSQSKNAILYLRKGLEVLGAHPGEESRKRAVSLLGALGRL